MFEVGKRYRAIRTTDHDKELGQIIEDKVYELCPSSYDHPYDNWKDEAGKMHYGWRATLFDPTPVDDAPASRMVTTCDIGARVVRVKIDERDNGKDMDCPVGKEITVKCVDEIIFSSVETGYWYYLSDFVLADEQPKKEAEKQTVGKCAKCGQIDCGQTGKNPCDICGLPLLHDKIQKSIDVHCTNCGEFHDPDMQCDKKTDPPDPVPGIASVMFGSKPRLMYGSLMQIQGPTKDEEARNARTEEERKRYER